MAQAENLATSCGNRSPFAALPGKLSSRFACSKRSRYASKVSPQRSASRRPDFPDSGSFGSELALGAYPTISKGLIEAILMPDVLGDGAQ